jgi:dCTP deaminase
LVLSKKDILRVIKQRRLKFNPPVLSENIAQVSIDLHLGRKFTTFKEPPNYLPHIRVDKSIWDSIDLWEPQESDSFILRPREFVLAQTQERVCMPADLVGMVEGRSSFARLGVTIHVTAPKIDPGFEGHITLEMANFGKVPVELRAGVDKPAQLILMKLSRPVASQSLYGKDSRDNFQYQTDPIPTRRR